MILKRAMLGNGTTNIPKDEFNEEVEFLGASVSVTFSGGSANTLTRSSLERELGGHVDEKTASRRVSHAKSIAENTLKFNFLKRAIK